ncbi:hypothetical protein [Flavobacterium sp.]|jgi:hypothetical protein|uniref:hypothetical protein n=1 Tax=Flavobacterium sp. TaxID=239 RepID=UPI0037BE7DEF
MLLAHILLAFLSECKKEVERLQDYNHPLGIFNNKITMCYYLVLIDKTIKEDLTLANKIRNKFAHDLAMYFDSKLLQSWCRELKRHKISLTPFHPNDATNRDLSQVWVHQHIRYLNGCVSIARNQKRPLSHNFK